MVIARKAQLRVQKKESGTVQSDTELTQAVDQWIKVEERYEQEKNQSKVAGKNVVDREAEEAAVHRANLLRSLHKKRNWSSEEENSESDSEPDDEVDKASKDENTALHIRHIHKKKRKISQAQKKNNDMVEAMKGLGASVALVAEKMNSMPDENGAMNNRLDRLEVQLEQEAVECRIQAEETKTKQD